MLLRIKARWDDGVCVFGFWHSVSVLPTINIDKWQPVPYNVNMATRLEGMSRIRKTRAMMEVEARAGKSLELLIPEILSEVSRDSDAAGRLGILPTTLSHWISKLQIHYECETARRKRLDKQAVA